MAYFDIEFFENTLGKLKGKTPAFSKFDSIVTDSRKTNQRVVFVALKGENHDGHDFIPQVVKNNCGLVICDKNFDTSLWPETAFIEVADTEAAFRKLAHHWRKQFHIPVLCVAGSVGKTTSKELLFAALHGKYKKILKTEASQNGFIGIPMTLLELRPEHEIAVVEVGIDECGAMEKHLALLEPTATLLTTIGPEHLEKLKDLETVASEECLSIFKTVESGGVVAINLSDPWIAKHCEKISSPQAVFFGIDGLKSKQKLVSGKYLEPNRLEINSEYSEKIEIENPLFGKHNALNLLGVVAFCFKLGLNAGEIKKGLSTFKQAYGRSEIQKLKNGMEVVCDYYNANPTSMVAGLELLTQVAKGRRMFACLADMRELGVEEEKFHRDLSDEIIKKKINFVYLYGDKMKWLFEELKKKKFAGNLEHFSTQLDMAHQLQKTAGAKDVLLIKGSRGMKMEEVFKQLVT